MKSLLSAFILSAATVLPVSAGIHDFNPANATPQPSRQRARVGQGQCITMTDNSKLCYIKTSNYDFSIAILDIDDQRAPQAVQMNCSTGRWKSFGPLTKQTLNLYMNEFCTRY